MVLDSGDSAGELEPSSGREAEVWGGERGSINGFGTPCLVTSFPEEFRGGDVCSNRWASEWSIRNCYLASIGTANLLQLDNQLLTIARTPRRMPWLLSSPVYSHENNWQLIALHFDESLNRRCRGASNTR
jgi:hypothetical protein